MKNLSSSSFTKYLRQKAVIARFRGPWAALGFSCTGSYHWLANNCLGPIGEPVTAHQATSLQKRSQCLKDGRTAVLVMLVEMVTMTLLVLTERLTEGADNAGVVKMARLHVLHEVVFLLGVVEADAALPHAPRPHGHTAYPLQDFI
jgi:hypothetical protein